MSAVTYSPRTRKFYVGSLETGVDFDKDSNYEPIAKLHPERKMGDGRIEFVAHEMVRKAERHRFYAVENSSDISNITVVDLLQEVINRQWRNFYAINAMRRIAVPKLQLNVPVATKYGASKKVPELVEASIKETDYAQKSFALWKNVVHVAASDEARLRGTIEPLSLEIDIAAGALAKAANEQIVVEIEGNTGSSSTTFTTAAKGDWGAMNSNGDFSNRNPVDDIQNSYTTIVTSDFRPDTITMNPRVASDYFSNTFVNGYAPATDRVLLGVVDLPKFPGVKAVIDPGFTATVATLFDSSTAMLGEGPTVAEQYRNPQAGFDGYVIRQWMQPLLTSSSAGIKMTSVSA